MEPNLARHSIKNCCLTYCSLSYAGVGWPQTCVSILEGFSGGPLRPLLALPRARAPLPSSIESVFGLAPPASALPWRYVAGIGSVMLERRFIELLDRADPASTIAYLWPGAPIRVLEHARSRGIVTIREMINSFQGTAKSILDEAYRQARLPIAHTITSAAVEAERRELERFDWICAPSPLVESSLLEAGIARGKIIPTSFGWSPARFAAEQKGGRPAARTRGPVRFLFIGLIGVRKGVPDLLNAWKRSGQPGTLTLVGDIERPVAPLVEEARRSGAVEVLPFTRDVGSLFRSHDILVFPTHEEGAPQVVFEAGGCGLPVITTPMGAARLVKDGSNGIVVPAGSPDALAAAIISLAADFGRQRQFSQRIAADARAFTYDKLGAARAGLFVERLALRAAERALPA